jgi:hypothetical protein
MKATNPAPHMKAPIVEIPTTASEALTNNLECPIYFFVFVINGLNQGKKFLPGG